MKIHVPNAVAASGPTMYGGFESVPITNLPLFLTAYETTIEQALGTVVWSAFSLKPSDALGTRRLNLQLRCYLYQPTDRFVVKCRFAPDDPVYAQYFLTVPWSSSPVIDGYMTIQNQNETWDVSDRMSFAYDGATNVLQLIVSMPFQVTHQSVFINAFL